MKSVFPKLTQSTFRPNWVKNTVPMLIVSILAYKLCHLSKTHPPTHTHEHTPIQTPNDLHTNLVSTPTITTHLPSLTHTKFKMTTLKTSSFLFCFCCVCCCCCFKLIQSNSLCPCIWIGTNLDWVSFGKVTGFQGINSVLSLDFIFFFLCINSRF